TTGTWSPISGSRGWCLPARSAGCKRGNGDSPQFEPLGDCPLDDRTDRFRRRGRDRPSEPHRHRTEANLGAIRDFGPFGDALAVDPRPVLAPEVLDPRRRPLDEDARVLARDAARI